MYTLIWLGIHNVQSCLMHAHLHACTIGPVWEFCMHAFFHACWPSSFMHEHACKCAKLHACIMHAMHACCRYDACMQCMHNACMHLACTVCMHSLEGLNIQKKTPQTWTRKGSWTSNQCRVSKWRVPSQGLLPSKDWLLTDLEISNWRSGI